MNRVFKRGSLMEKLVYEIKPAIYGLIALSALSLSYTGQLGKTSGLLLLFCTTLIVYGRLKHRGFLK